MRVRAPLRWGIPTSTTQFLDVASSFPRLLAATTLPGPARRLHTVRPLLSLELVRLPAADRQAHSFDSLRERMALRLDDELALGGALLVRDHVSPLQGCEPSRVRTVSGVFARVRYLSRGQHRPGV